MDRLNCFSRSCIPFSLSCPSPGPDAIAPPLLLDLFLYSACTRPQFHVSCPCCGLFHCFVLLSLQPVSPRHLQHPAVPAMSAWSSQTPGRPKPSECAASPASSRDVRCCSACCGIWSSCYHHDSWALSSSQPHQADKVAVGKDSVWWGHSWCISSILWCSALTPGAAACSHRPSTVAGNCWEAQGGGWLVRPSSTSKLPA